MSPGELRNLYETGQLVNAEYDVFSIQNNLIPVTVDLRGLAQEAPLAIVQRNILTKLTLTAQHIMTHVNFGMK